MSGSEGEDRLLGTVRDLDQFLGVLGAVARGTARSARASDRTSACHPLDAGDTLHDQVFASNRTRLVKAADVDLARKRDAERLGAEDG